MRRTPVPQSPEPITEVLIALIVILGALTQNVIDAFPHGANFVPRRQDTRERRMFMLAQIKTAAD
jgi:hypothetical protein